MLRNKKFKFEDDFFTTAFLVLVSVGWFSLAFSSNTENPTPSVESTASIAPIATKTANRIAKNIKAEKKSEKADKVEKPSENAKSAEAYREVATTQVASAESADSEKINDRALRDLKAMTDKINSKAGSVVVYYDDAGPIEKLHVNADFLLLTDRRPRVSAEKSKMVAPAIIAFSARKKVAAYIDHNSSVPETYIVAVERYIRSYNNLKVERRLLTTASDQLELTLEVQ